MILKSNKKRFSKVIFKKIFHYSNNSKKLKLTVAIPTYKRKSLYRAISSLANQSFKDFILIISDNTVDQYEANLMRRVCGLIYFPDKECAEIKLKLLNNK